MCQKQSIVCLSQIPIQVCDHVVLEWILIVARSNYFSSNILTGMLYCTEQLIITIFVQKMTPPHVVWSHHKQILPYLVLQDQHPQAHQARGTGTPAKELQILN
jgi:hypothetical protein